MPEAERRVYWDSSVFLSYINAIPDRMPDIETLLDEAQKGNLSIVTSTLTIVEVAYGAAEKAGGKLDDAVDRKISSLWNPPIGLLEFHTMLAEESRRLMRKAVEQGWKLTPLDAVHLASALRHSVLEFHTYDETLLKHGGGLGLKPSQPTSIQQRLGLS